MRWLTVMCAVAAICVATEARAEPRVCLEWGSAPADGGADDPPYKWLTSDSEPDVTTDPPDGGGIEVPPPPTLRKVCLRYGWRDEDTGCSAAVGLPLGGAALALLGLLARRPRRSQRRNGESP
jgi:hypothetical protein